MPKPVFLMTVHEAHKEYNSLIDQIWAKYKLLDSGECGSVGTQAFNAECSKLAHLMAHMSELCKHLNLPMPKELHRPPYFKHWSRLNSKLFLAGLVRVWRMQLYHSFVRITGLLSAPIEFKNLDWLCVLPAITLVVWQVPEHLNTKLPPWTAWWWTAKPTEWTVRLQQAFPPWWGEGPLYTESVSSTSSTWICILHTVLRKSRKHHLWRLRHT